jgi:hypothetical protein
MELWQLLLLVLIGLDIAIQALRYFTERSNRKDIHADMEWLRQSIDQSMGRTHRVVVNEADAIKGMLQAMTSAKTQARRRK